MANENRIAANSVSGTGLTCTNVATSITQAGFSALPTVDTTNYCALICESEIMWVTAHAAASATVTVIRAQEGTVAVAHANAAWQHGPTAQDCNPLWVNYTPTLVQSVTVTKTVTYARYVKIGRLVTASGSLTVTGAGTANANIVVGLPFAANFLAFTAIGTAYIFKSSTTTNVSGTAAYDSANGFNIVGAGSKTVATSRLGLTGSDFPTGLAAGDIVHYTVTYEAVA